MESPVGIENGRKHKNIQHRTKKAQVHSQPHRKESPQDSPATLRRNHQRSHTEYTQNSNRHAGPRFRRPRQSCNSQEKASRAETTRPGICSLLCGIPTICRRCQMERRHTTGCVKNWPVKRTQGFPATYQNTRFLGRIYQAMFKTRFTTPSKSRGKEGTMMERELRKIQREQHHICPRSGTCGNSYRI